jgi:hypothetical protein
MNEEELMLVLTEVVRWQHLCEMGLSVSARVVHGSLLLWVLGFARATTFHRLGKLNDPIRGYSTEN